MKRDRDGCKIFAVNIRCPLASCVRVDRRHWPTSTHFLKTFLVSPAQGCWQLPAPQPRVRWGPGSLCHQLHPLRAWWPSGISAEPPAPEYSLSSWCGKPASWKQKILCPSERKRHVFAPNTGFVLDFPPISSRTTQSTMFLGCSTQSESFLPHSPQSCYCETATQRAARWVINRKQNHRPLANERNGFSVPIGARWRCFHSPPPHPTFSTGARWGRQRFPNDVIFSWPKMECVGLELRNEHSRHQERLNYFDAPSCKTVTK